MSSEYRDKLVEFLIRQNQKLETANDPVVLSGFRVTKKAKESIEPSRIRAEKHREREAEYTKKLEEAEKDLRENGVSVEVFDPQAGYTIPAQGCIASGAISSMQSQFQPRVNNEKMEKVKAFKNKMLEHRQEAEKFEKWGRAFRCNPDETIVLTVEEVHWFRLEG